MGQCSGKQQTKQTKQTAEQQQQQQVQQTSSTQQGQQNASTAVATVAPESKYSDKSGLDHSAIPLSTEARLEFLSSQKFSAILRGQSTQTPENYVDSTIDACEITHSALVLEQGIVYMRDRIAENMEKILKNIDQRSRQALEVNEFYTQQLKKPSYRHLLQLFTKSEDGKAVALNSIFSRVFSASVKTIQLSIALMYSNKPDAAVVSSNSRPSILSKDALFDEIKRVAELIDAENLRRADEIAVILSHTTLKQVNDDDQDSHSNHDQSLDKSNHRNDHNQQLIGEVVDEYLTRLYEDIIHKQCDVPTIISVVNTCLTHLYTSATDALCQKHEILKLQQSVVQDYLQKLYKGIVHEMQFLDLDGEEDLDEYDQSRIKCQSSSALPVFVRKETVSFQG